MRRVGGLELKAELTLEGCAEGRGGVTDLWIGDESSEG